MLMGLLLVPLANCRCADLEGQSAYENAVRRQMAGYVFAQDPATVYRAGRHVLADRGYVVGTASGLKATTHWLPRDDDRQSRAILEVEPKGGDRC